MSLKDRLLKKYVKAASPELETLLQMRSLNPKERLQHALNDLNPILKADPKHSQKLAPALKLIQEVLKEISATYKDQIPGGKADDKTPLDFDAEKLKKGAEHEMEHTYDPQLGEEIAMDHLVEDPDYYEKLEQIENTDAVEKVAAKFLRKVHANEYIGEATDKEKDAANAFYKFMEKYIDSGMTPLRFLKGLMSTMDTAPNKKFHQTVTYLNLELPKLISFLQKLHKAAELGKR